MSVLEAASERLAPEAAEALWRRWRLDGDAAARDRLALSYAPLVRYLALRKARELPAHVEIDDLVSCGLIALLEAVDHFDPAKGATFEQYAWTRVSGALLDELRRQDLLSRGSRRTARRIERARETRHARTGDMPTDAEVAKDLSLTVEEVRETVAMAARADLASLDAPVSTSDGSGTVSVIDTVEAAEGTAAPEKRLLAGERAGVFRSALESLSQVERRVIVLSQLEDVPGRQISAMLGVSDSRVSQILNGARRKLALALAQYEQTGRA